MRARSHCRTWCNIARDSRWPVARVRGHVRREDGLFLHGRPIDEPKLGHQRHQSDRTDQLDPGKSRHDFDADGNRVFGHQWFQLRQRRQRGPHLEHSADACGGEDAISDYCSLRTHGTPRRPASSTNAGTQSSPFDLATALSKAAANTKIVLEAGTYNGAAIRRATGGVSPLRDSADHRRQLRRRHGRAGDHSDHRQHKGRCFPTASST